MTSASCCPTSTKKTSQELSTHENTSSCTSTVGAGPFVLDTGQRAAKILLSEIYTIMLTNNVSGGMGFAQGGWRLGHVGKPSSAAGALCGHEVCHDWKRGTRLGEADHPGPSGGGARATARRRAEEGDGDMTMDDGMGFAAMLRPIVEKLIRQVLKEILGGGAVKQMLAGMLANTSSGPLAAPVAGDEVPAEGEGMSKRARWRQRRGDGDVGADGPAKGKGKSGGAEPSKGKGKSSGTELREGKGKSSGDEPGKGNGKSSGAEPTKGNGKSSGAEAGKGKSAAGQADGDAADGGEWTVVGRRLGDWALRAGDWSDPVLSYDELVAKASGGDAPVRAVALVSEEQRDVLTSLFRGAAKQHALLLVEQRSGERTERCPGSCGGRLAFRQVFFTRACTPGLEPPKPRVQAAGGKLEVLKSSVVFCRFLQRYHDKEVWQQILKQPQRVLFEHLAKHRLKAVDSWGWCCEDVEGSPFKRVFGKLRVSDKDIPGLLATSGQCGFFEPARSFAMDPVTTEWVPQQDGETPAAYLQRCLAVKADFGLVAGRRQLAKRLRRDASTPVQRLWLVQTVPAEVTVEQLTAVLAQTFQDVEMVWQRRRGGTRDFTFRAKTAEAADSIALPLEFGDQQVVLWVRHAPPKRGQQAAQVIHTSASWSLLPPKPAFATEPRQGVPEALETGDVAGGAGGDKEATALSKDGTKAAEAAKRAAPPAAPAAKRVAGNQRALPPGAKITAVEKDGNCLFASVALGLNRLRRDPETEKEWTAAEIRAKVAVHLRKNEQKYVPQWDREMPDRTQARNWEAYVAAIETDKVWGGLTELRGISRTFDVRVIVFPQNEHVEPFHIHGQAKKRTIGLYFTGSHYDLLEGSEGAALPKSILNIRAPPEDVPMRGGGRGSGDVAARPAFPPFGSARAATKEVDGGTPGSVWTSGCGDATPASVWTLDQGAATPASVWTQAGSRSAAGGGRRPSSAFSVASGGGDVRLCSSASSVASPGDGGARLSAGTLASLTAGRAGGRTPSVAPSSPDWGAVDELEEGAAVMAARPRPPFAMWWGRKSTMHPALQRDGSFKLQCEHCAKVFKAKDSSALAKLRYNHYVAWHPDEPRNFGRFPCKEVQLKVLPKSAAVDWRCPCCRVAVPRGGLEAVSKTVWARAREGHRLQAHPELSRVAFAVRCRTAGTRTARNAMRLRTVNLNKGQARRQTSGGKAAAAGSMSGFVCFTWPQLRRGKKTEAKLCLYTAWRCRRCPCVYPDAKSARAHRCGETARLKGNKKRIKALKKLRRRAGTLRHGIAEDLLARTFDTALRMLSGEAMDP